MRSRACSGTNSVGRAVQAEFRQVITRRRYSELVGIHPTTLRRWQAAGILRSWVETVLNSPTHVFQESDVAFGKRLADVLRERPGELNLREAARIAERS